METSLEISQAITIPVGILMSFPKQDLLSIWFKTGNYEQ